MPSLNLVSRKFFPAGSVFLLLLILTPGRGVAETGEKNSDWLWQPWIGTAGGYESDLILDPDFSWQVVPGGGFIELSPGFRLIRPLSDRTSFRLLNRNTVERFFNSEGRTLFASSLLGDFRFRGQSAFRGRATLNVDYFNDSGSDSFRRLSGGGEVGAGAQFARWGFEISGYLQGRRYPNVLALADNNQTLTYTESHHGMAGYLIWNPLGNLFFKGTLNGRRTDSVDPVYESTSWTASGSVEYLLMTGTWLSGNLSRQSRDFSNRIPGEDHDSYAQVGVGLSRVLTSHLNLSVRYAHSAYTYPLGGEQKTDRFSVGVTWQFGKKSPPIMIRTMDSAGPRRGGYTAGNAVPFRIQASDAKSVALVGSFNNWNPQANPLRKTDQGWWETSLVLGAGTHEYLYLVDGEQVVPPEADRTVADGFGGFNGILQISPINGNAGP